MYEPNSLAFAFGIRGHQSGTLTAGDSDITDTTVSFLVSTTAIDGVTLFGAGADSEVFEYPDPSVQWAAGSTTGTSVSYPHGEFLVRFGGGRSTDLSLTRVSSDGNNPLSGDQM
ncbi:MAG: hypothetical protein ACLFP4_16690 [Spirochaetales bacterium]